MRPGLLLTLLVIPAFAQKPQTPTPETRSWWSHVQFLASDKLEGRDTGSAGYKDAARYVEEQFERAGLKPAGESGYRQPVPLRSLAVRPDSSVELVRGKAITALKLNEQIGVTPRLGIPGALDAPLFFIGSADGDITGKIGVTITGTKPGKATGAAGMMAIDNPRALEAPRWPIAYAKTVAIEGGRPRAAAAFDGLSMRLNPDLTALLFEGSGHTFTELLDLASAGKPLPSFPLNGNLRTRMQVDAAQLTSDNLIAVLPGTDLKDQYLVVSAHLDGYGIGTPVNGDSIYNGAFDDAACVALLIELARDIKASGKAPRRSIVFAVFTGEEKGLLGSDYFTNHLTVPKEKVVADINLDYIRPMWPLKILTVLGLDESTLGKSARQAAEALGVKVQPDNEPERGLYRRSDQYNFIRAGIPGIAFIFGYEKGSKEEEIYRAWYRDRYHKPADDVNQPVNWEGAAKFQQFFTKLATAVANADERPH